MADEPTTYEQLGDDGQYIVIEQYDSNGQTVQGYERFSLANGETELTAAFSEALEDKVVVVQNESENDTGFTTYEQMMLTCSVLTLIAVFMCLGAIACRTLMRSFER